MSLVNVGDSQRFDYTGAIQELPITKNGIYKLEVWGAAGGASLNNGSVTGAGGAGGYSVGYTYLTTEDVLYIVCGGKGENGPRSRNAVGGYNGGGNGTWDNSDDESSGAGGGATHIALVTGTLVDIGKELFDEKGLIVAGGGGGKSWNYGGGTGGGVSGGNGTNGRGGTASSYYAFGKGQNASGTGDSDGVAGAGAGYYGGFMSSTSGASGAGGGSGFIGNVLNGTTTNGVNSGNGYAIITLTITAEVNPIDGGTLTYTFVNDKLSLESVPNIGWKFLNWQLNDYTQLEYIESTGTQYIKSGVAPKNIGRFKTDFAFTGITSNYSFIIGVSQSGYIVFGINSSGKFSYRFGSTSQTDLQISPTINTFYEYEIVINNSSYIVKQNTNTIVNVTSSAQTGTTYNTGLFAYTNDNSIYQYFAKGKMSYAKIYDTQDVLIRDFIPVFKHSTGEIGLLDLCQLKFYGNSGTDLFIGGDPVWLI